MHEIVLPRLNSNDTTYILIEWLVEEGQVVGADDPVVVVETSKAIEDLCAGASVLIHRLAEEGQQGAVGTVIGQVFVDAQELEQSQASPERAGTVPTQTSGSPASVGSTCVQAETLHGSGETGGPALLTDAARLFAQQNGLGPAEVSRLFEGHRGVVRRQDVLRALGGVTAHRGVPRHPLERVSGQRTNPFGDGEAVQSLLSAVPAARGASVTGTEPEEPAASVEPVAPWDVSSDQRAVATAVTRSHATIPAAFCLVKVDATPFLEARRRVREAGGPLVELPEVLIRVMAEQQVRFPQLYATAVEASSPGTHVAVTMDAGHGLYLPVVHAADRLSVNQIRSVLLQYARCALAGTFRASELAGSTISLSITPYHDVLLNVPIIPPDHVCMLSLAALQKEVVIDDNGAPTRRRWFPLGIAFDHRAVNGRDAIIYLRAVRTVVESAQDLDRLLG